MKINIKAEAEIKQKINYRTYKQGDICACICCEWFMNGRYRCVYGCNNGSSFSVSAYGTCDNAEKLKER